jgi:hypothetical protein
MKLNRRGRPVGHVVPRSNEHPLAQVKTEIPDGRRRLEFDCFACPCDVEAEPSVNRRLEIQ